MNQNLKIGQGVYTYANGDVYEGQFQQDLKSGEGKQSFSSTQVEYIGEFSQDCKVGKGTLDFGKYGKFEGQFNREENMTG